MAKDPAFLFYPNDYIGGTMGMSFEEKGCYMELLMMQFNQGKFTEAQAKQVLSICFNVAWPKIKNKFKSNGDLFWNVRLQEEIEKRRKFTESRRSNASNPKKTEAQAKHMDKHMDKHMEDENININRIELREEIFKSEVSKFRNYPAWMLEEFTDYWTEPNKSGTKMRWEMEKTWDLKRRLERWGANIKLKAPTSKKQPVEIRTGKPMTQNQIMEYYKEHGKYPGK